MGKSLLRFNPRNANEEIDEVAIEYKLKLIAFEDELFQSRRTLQESDNKMAALQRQLDEYLQNKGNQIAEVRFTAFMNAQRIEAQTRSQTDSIILEMEDEIRSKQKEMEMLQKKTNCFVNDIQPDTTGQDNLARLQIVQDNIRALRDQIETTKLTNVTLENKQQAKIADLPLESKEQGIELQKADKSRVNKEQASEANNVDNTVDNKNQNTKQRFISRKLNKSRANKDQVLTPELLEDAMKPRDKAVANETVESSAELKDQILSSESADGSIELKDQVVATEMVNGAAEYNDQIAEENVVKPQAATQALGAENDRYKSAKQGEQNERMRLDAFVDTRYYDKNAGPKQVQHHALQITIEVEVPFDNYSVRYTKVSSDVVSTLMNYDNIILNELFPFNLIEPNPENIAMYFFNCLDDMLSLMDLKIHSLTMLELPDLQVRINTRNYRFDNLLYRGDDYLRNIRKSLIPCVETESDVTSPLKGKFSRILKKRG